MNTDKIIAKQTALTIAQSNYNISNIICRNIQDPPISIPKIGIEKCCAGLTAIVTEDPLYPADIKLYSCS
jgi:hypothetical protein